MSKQERADKLCASKHLLDDEDMERAGIYMDLKEVQHLERRRRYEMPYAIKQRDERALGISEDKFLKEFIAEYKLVVKMR